MPAITTHILDTSLGKPASHVVITLESLLDPQKPMLLAETCSNDDGRVLPSLYESALFSLGSYRLTFMIEEYFLRSKRPCFYPSITVHFLISNPEQHYHIPLLVSPFGYSTYRGS